MRGEKGLIEYLCLKTASLEDWDRGSKEGARALHTKQATEGKAQVRLQEEWDG